MLLCVDVGNTFVKTALLEGPRILAFSKERSERIAGELNSFPWEKILRKGKRIEGTVVSSVVPFLTPIIERTLARATGESPLVVESSLVFPFEICVRRPRNVGTDRLCAAAGALAFRARNAIVIDVGSAITVDVISRGKFKGGVIMAGPALALRALAQHTAKLPRIASHSTRTLFPGGFDRTERAMVLGAGLASLGAIREAVREIERIEGRSPKKLLTGGGAPLILKKLPVTWRYDPHLVLRGLSFVWRLNREV